MRFVLTLLACLVAPGCLAAPLVVGPATYATVADAVTACPSDGCEIVVTTPQTIPALTIAKPIKLKFAPGVYPVTGTIALQSQGGLIFEGAGAPNTDGHGGTVFRWQGNATDPMFKLTSIADSVFRDFSVVSAPDHPLAAAFLSPNVDPGPNGPYATRDTFSNIVVNGTNPGGLAYGFRFATGTPPANTNNNDFMAFYHVTVFNYTQAAWSIEDPQAKSYRFYDCNFQSRSMGKYGVTTALGVDGAGGSFWWFGGGGGYNTVADFYLGNPDDTIQILGGNFEGSSRLLETVGGSSGAWAILIQGVRWAGNNLNADGRAVVYTHRGPLTLISNTFQNRGSIKSLSIDLDSSAPQAYGLALGNAFESSLSNPLTGYGRWSGIGNTLNSGPAVMLPAQVQ